MSPAGRVTVALLGMGAVAAVILAILALGVLMGASGSCAR